MANKLFMALSALVVADCALTAYAVGYLGITEPNPLFELCGGFNTFMVVKLFASAFCLMALYILYNSIPKVADVFIWFLCGMYGVVVFGGLIGIILMMVM